MSKLSLILSNFVKRKTRENFRDDIFLDFDIDVIECQKNSKFDLTLNFEHNIFRVKNDLNIFQFLEKLDFSGSLAIHFQS